MTYKVSKVINAPIKYVYDWATDYRSEDNLITGSSWPKMILFRSKKKAVYASYKNGSDGKPKLAVRFVTLDPSSFSWHLDYFAEEDIEDGEYKLTKLAKEKTRLDIVLHNKWKKGRGPSQKEFEEHGKLVWEKYAKALEKDYDSGKLAS